MDLKYEAQKKQNTIAVSIKYNIEEANKDYRGALFCTPGSQISAEYAAARIRVAYTSEEGSLRLL